MPALLARWLGGAVFASAALAVVGVSAYYRGHDNGAARVQAQWDAAQAHADKAALDEMIRAQQREQALQAQIDQTKRVHREQVNRIHRDHAAIVDSLRYRTDRPADGGSVPGAATAGAELANGCTGAELYRPDGEFLAGEAARADRLRLALAACQRAYESLIRRDGSQDTEATDH